ncbi:MAG: site-2 protease family protein [Ruminococcus sp.]|nr:site-2 protease family protein [Ruminococcus sp.]
MLRTLLSGHLDLKSAIAHILALLVIIFLILPLHEWAHAFTASLLGDKAIKQRGRLSLNPIDHIDPMGVIFMFVFGYGWAKPVPIDPRNFKNPKVGMAISAAAGPISNILAALVGFLILYPVVLFAPSTEIINYVEMFLQFYITCNISLAVFNLVPFPPLDGSKILFAFLPDKAVNFFYKYQQVFYIALFALVYIGILDVPLSFASNALWNWLSKLAFLPYKLFM